VDATAQLGSLCEGDSEDDEMDWYSDEEEDMHGHELHAGRPRNTLDEQFPPDYVPRSASSMWWHDDRKSIAKEEDFAVGNLVNAVHLNQDADQYMMSMGVSTEFVRGFSREPAVASEVS